MRNNVNEYDMSIDLLLRIAGQAAGFLRDLLAEVEANKLEEIIGVQPLGDTTRRIDLLAEEYIVDLIRNEGFKAIIITEERGRIEIGDNPEYIFVVDPLDVSSNYLSHIPWSSVSIAVTSITNRPSLKDIEAGVIAPIHVGYPIVFVKGKGVYYGRTKVRTRKEIRDLVLGYFDQGIGVKVLDKLLATWKDVKVRSLGCASLEIAYVVLGLADAFLDVRGWLRNVDVAAALGMAYELKLPLSVDLDSIPAYKVVKIGRILVAKNTQIFEKVLKIAHEALIT